MLSVAWLGRMVLRPLVEHKDVRALGLLHHALQPLLLRRTKATRMADGSPIVQLPPRSTTIEWLLFTPEERDFYDALRTQSRVKFDAFVAEGRVLNNYAHVLAMLLQLRQACDHPHLVLSRADTDADLGRIGKQLLRRWREMKQATGESVEGAAGAQSLVSQSRYLEDTLLRLKRQASGGPQGPQGPQGSALAEDKENSNAPSDEAAGAEAAAEAAGGKAAEGEAEGEECVVCLDAFDDAVLTSCAHQFCRECILGCIGAMSCTPCPVCRLPVSRQDLITLPRASRFSVDLDRHWRNSSKIDALMADVHATLATPLPPPMLLALPAAAGKAVPAVAKVCIFSQWTAMLDLVERPLRADNLRFVRLDGSMSLPARGAALQRFASDPHTRVMLLSLKSGGVGLNLVAAQTVYLLDPWWNPAVEEQAVNRIHRIGQRYPVRVKHFMMSDSVEVRIHELQKKKAALVKGAIGGVSKEDAKGVRVDELRLLFS